MGAEFTDPISTRWGDENDIAEPDAKLPPESVTSSDYLTSQDNFGTIERGDPLPYKIPRERRLEIGLERETWRLEVVADPVSDTILESPLSIEGGTALDFDALIELGKKHGVQYLKGITCNNTQWPLGMGLWEGVPLRVVVWMTRPVNNLRRVFYYGYHNDDPEQMFRSSLPIGRVLEDPPGELPVILCYKLNGEYLSGKRGGPVRMLIPDAYGFKSVKWLQRVVLTNNAYANDTYALWNNDVDSTMKSFARFSNVPTELRANEPFKIAGKAQVGVSGLRHVQFWLSPADTMLPGDDPHFTRAEWKNAEILPWDGELPANRPGVPLHFDPTSGRPRKWPLRYTLVHWQAEIRGVVAGNYNLRCRTIDLNGIPQPMPRPFARSGRVGIETVRLRVEA